MTTRIGPFILIVICLKMETSWGDDDSTRSDGGAPKVYFTHTSPEVTQKLLAGNLTRKQGFPNYEEKKIVSEGRQRRRYEGGSRRSRMKKRLPQRGVGDETKRVFNSRMSYRKL